MIEDKKSNKYYAAAFFSQFGVLAVCIALHRLFIHLGGLIGAAEQVGSEMSDPTAGRFAYMILCAAAFLILSALASRKAKAGKDFAPFILGCFAGTFLWQCVGEDCWHFSVSGTHFIVLESISALPIAILFLILLAWCCRTKSLDWGLWCALLSFSVNWYGHYVLIGIYPLFSGLCSESVWCRTVGQALGCVLLLLSLIIGLKKAHAPRQKMAAAILSYYAAAIFVFGTMGA